MGRSLKLKLPALRQSPRVRFSFSWYADGKRIKKQTRSSLKLTKALKGKRISVTLTATKVG